MLLEWELSWGQILSRWSIRGLSRASGKWWRDVLFLSSLPVAKRWETTRISLRWSRGRWPQGQQASPLVETFSSTKTRRRSYRQLARSSTAALRLRKRSGNWGWRHEKGLGKSHTLEQRSCLGRYGVRGGCPLGSCWNGIRG